MVERLLDRFPDRFYRAIAIGVAVVSLLMAAAALYLGERSMRGFLRLAFLTADKQRPIVVAALTIYALLGGLLTYRLPRLSYGWLWAWLGFSMLFVEFARWYTAYDIFIAHRYLPLRHFMAWLSMAAWTTSLVLLSYTLLLFPAGRLPSPRWRWLAWLLPAVGVVAWLSSAFLPGLMRTVPYNNPYPWLQYPYIAPVARVRDWSLSLLYIILVLSGLSVILRLRRARGAERQQVKWFAFAALLASLFFALTPLAIPLRVRQYTYDVAGAVVFTLLALAMTVAILRFRLYDIDLIIRRTLAYTVVTLFLGSLYLGTVILLQSVLVSMTGRSSSIAVVLSTLAIAALFNPLRLRVQGLIDQRFFRQKYDAQFVLEAFTAVARDETDVDRLSAELAAVVKDTMQPTAVQVWLRAPQA
jgi:hypothetical protein